MIRPLALLPLLLLAACGTYSALRPATVAPPGHVELGLGLAANQLGEVLPVLDGRVGIARRLELGGHYEVYSGYLEARVAVLEQASAGVSLAVSAGGGFATTLIDEFDSPDGAAFLSLAASRRLGRVVEPYVSVRWAYLAGARYVLAPVGGAIFQLSRRVGISVEGGASIHFRDAGSVGLAQGAVGLSLRL